VGREARCAATWGARSGQVTALLESTELIVRGAFRARAPLASLRGVRADGETLRFRAGDDEVALVLGPAAGRWAAAIAKPPPSLAAKFGITPLTRIAIEGTIDDDALAAAVGTGKRAGQGDEPDLILARVDDADELARVAHRWSAQLERRVPFWVVYTKGKAAPLGESAVRAMLRERGLIDLKVAAVSPALTALLFVRRLRR
jgi:hypothetical protein